MVKIVLESTDSKEDIGVTVDNFISIVVRAICSKES